MHLLKKDIPFHWDKVVQHSFEAFKCTLMSTPLIRPPNYNKYFLLYLDTAELTISMVLVQEDDFLS
jgi:hypothetical protein